MSADLTHRDHASNVAQQQFLSLFLRSEREIFRYVAALVPILTDAEDILEQTALALWEKFDADAPAHLAEANPDEFELFNRALDDAAVHDLYLEGKPQLDP